MIAVPALIAALVGAASGRFVFATVCALICAAEALYAPHRGRNR